MAKLNENFFSFETAYVVDEEGRRVKLSIPKAKLVYATQGMMPLKGTTGRYYLKFQASSRTALIMLGTKGLENPDIRWEYQKLILSTPFRWLGKQLRKIDGNLLRN